MAADIYRQSRSVTNENTLHEREVEETKKNTFRANAAPGKIYRARIKKTRVYY